MYAAEHASGERQDDRAAEGGPRKKIGDRRDREGDGDSSKAAPEQGGGSRIEEVPRPPRVVEKQRQAHDYEPDSVRPRDDLRFEEAWEDKDCYPATGLQDPKDW
jgi:hypothetical protein